MPVAEMSYERQRTVADIRLADADEFVAGAQIETAFEHGFDMRARMAPAELPREHARSQDPDDDIGVIGREGKVQTAPPNTNTIPKDIPIFAVSRESPEHLQKNNDPLKLGFKLTSPI